MEVNLDQKIPNLFFAYRNTPSQRNRHFNWWETVKCEQNLISLSLKPGSKLVFKTNIEYQLHSHNAGKSNKILVRINQPDPALSWLETDKNWFIYKPKVADFFTSLDFSRLGNFFFSLILPDDEELRKTKCIGRTQILSM